MFFALLLTAVASLQDPNHSRILLASAESKGYSRRLLQSGECYNANCGCPGSFLEEWCDDTQKPSGEWCQASENCGSCGGVWCPDNIIIEKEKTPKGSCWISDCGCPGSFLEDWCDAGNPNHQPQTEYCLNDEGRCVNECQGTWCPSDGIVKFNLLGDDDLDGICYISECGCPTDFLEDWCDESDMPSDEYCQSSSGRCEGDCSGTWCPIPPTTAPSVGPTANPTVAPTVYPSVSPTVNPTVAPTVDPTVAPTTVPSKAPFIPFCKECELDIISRCLSYRGLWRLCEDDSLCEWNVNPCIGGSQCMPKVECSLNNLGKGDIDVNFYENGSCPVVDDATNPEAFVYLQLLSIGQGKSAKSSGC